MDWRDPAGKVLIVQDSSMVFYADPKLRIIDISAVLTAAEDVTLGDSHDGLLAIRLAEPFTEKGGRQAGGLGRPHRHAASVGQARQLG